MMILRAERSHAHAYGSPGERCTIAAQVGFARTLTASIEDDGLERRAGDKQVYQGDEKERKNEQCRADVRVICSRT